MLAHDSVLVVDEEMSVVWGGRGRASSWLCAYFVCLCMHMQWASVLNDPANSDKLIVFMAKAKGCRPCKQFAGKYNTIAEHFVDSVFVTCIGDRNESTRGLMRSMKVRATPTFMFYRGQEKVHEHSGINGQKMLDALEDYVVEGEAGWGERCIHFEGKILSTEEQAEE